MKRRRRRYHAPARRMPPAVKQEAPRPRSRSAEAPLSINLLRVIVCGVLFVSLVALKLTLPGSLAQLRGTLGNWLVRDADFVSAFSAVGRAVSGEGGWLDSLEDAYVAVFGEEEATEVSGSAEIAQTGAQAAVQDETPPVPAQEYPEHAVLGQRVLGFDYAAPLRGEVTSAFGWREHPASGREAFHYGVDIAAEPGAEIDCFADGTVGVVAESVELGRYLTVHHDNGIVTLYAHCSRITVPSGATVRRGEKLAEVGETGNATGPHLHFEIHDGEDYIDPIYYLS
ncbi:MAG: M23 family metallopeptidase [Ruminococcaceae bacterium]|nr:M23 family metallopeptidase [Oscillospiraceae bacterium]